MSRSRLLIVGFGAFLASLAFAGAGCGPTNTSHTEFHEHTDTTTGGSGPTQQPNQNPGPVIEEKRSAPETIVQ